MIKVMLLDDAEGHIVGGEELLLRWRATPGSRLWLDIEGEPSDDTHKLLAAMHCSEFAINDCFRARHPPKVEHFEGNSFILFRGIEKFDDTLELSPQQIGLWVGADYLISVHRSKSVSIDHLWQQQLQQRILQHPGILALNIIHYACGRYLEKLLDFEDHLADLEDEILSERSEQGMKELVGYRSRLRKLRRIFSYHKEIAEHIWQHSSPFFGDEQSSHVRRDVYDRCERLYSLCQMYYEICGDLVDGHISLSSHKLNQTMKILTIISAVFVPITFLAGIYGMNFENMPELGWKYAYFTVLGVMALSATAMLVVFRRMRWL